MVQLERWIYDLWAYCYGPSCWIERFARLRHVQSLNAIPLPTMVQVHVSHMLMSLNQIIGLWQRAACVTHCGLWIEMPRQGLCSHAVVLMQARRCLMSSQLYMMQVEASLDILNCKYLSILETCLTKNGTRLDSMFGIPLASSLTYMTWTQQGVTG